MDSMNKKKHEVTHDEERNNFIREQVRPQKKKEYVKLLTRLGMIVISAVIFGGIAGGIMLYCQEQVIVPEKKVVQIQYPTAPAETQEPEEESQSKKNKNTLGIEGNTRLSEHMAAIGDRMSSSMAGIRGKSLEQEKLVVKNNRQIYCGVVMKETDKEFFLLTSSMVTRERKKVAVEFQGQKAIDGVVLGTDHALDLSVVSVKKSSIKEEVQKRIKVATFNPSKMIYKGTNVIAVGNPGGVFHSVVIGRVCNTELTASIIDREIKLYLTDMPYANTESGVVIDTEGNVIGVITKEFIEQTGDVGMAFMDISSIQATLEFLQADKQVPNMGIIGMTVGADMAKMYDMNIGVYITSVISKSPAYNAGVRVADLITKIDGTSVMNMSELHHILVQHKKGDILNVTVSRKSESKTIEKQFKVKLG